MMVPITTELGDAILAHAKAVYPAECCGLIIGGDSGTEYVPCRNLAEGDAAKDRFVLCPQDWVAAEDRGEVLAVVHSHPNESANPTHADLVMMERTQLPWVIIGYPSGVITQTEPKGERLPLVGRQFHHGIVDCWGLIRDYFAVRTGIELPDYERADGWWEEGPNGEPGQDLYLTNLGDAGFVRVGGSEVTPRAHDLILMTIRANQPNHAAVYDGERPGLILHHLHGRLSGHDVWGGYWARHCVGIYRHRDLEVS